MNTHTPSQILRLLLFRSVAMFAVLAIALWVYLPSATAIQRQGLFYLCGLAVIFSATQGIIIWRKMSLTAQLLCQFGMDALLISLLVFVTGGFHSPFVLLFGLVIVANGIHAHSLSVAVVSVAACIGYLVAVHTYSWVHHEVLPEEATLQLLLQVSILLLVGGIMAALARRHVGLTRESDRVVRQHENLQRMHHQVMSSMSEGMIVLDRFFNIQDYNEAAHQLLQTREVIGQSVFSVSILPAALLNFFQQGKDLKFQCEWLQDERTYLVQAGRLPENGNLACWLLTFVDVSDMKSLEKQLMEHNKLAAMGRMAAMLAHELRNPMHTMSHAVDLLDKVSAPQQQQIQRIVHEEILRLNRLISDMLNYTRPLEPKPEPCTPAAIIAASLAQEDVNAHHQVTVDCSVNSMQEDPNHLRLVFDNLLRNALQASPEPATVTIHCYACSDHEGWRVQVVDHGAGIPESIRATVFEPFASESSGGTGLGLATVWQVCRANQWQLRHHRQDDCTFFTIEHSPDHAEQGEGFILTTEVPVMSHG
ncbi:MAG: ATP-binding protein [Mariprofundaceae bacterium]|nr:ATP-binding protein [Mariprofundaceae bacterium]